MEKYYPKKQVLDKREMEIKDSITYLLKEKEKIAKAIMLHEKNLSLIEQMRQESDPVTKINEAQKNTNKDTKLGE